MPTHSSCIRQIWIHTLLAIGLGEGTAVPIFLEELPSEQYSKQTLQIDQRSNITLLSSNSMVSVW
jgi:hypothetical protein